MQIAAFSTANRGFFWITIDDFFENKCQQTLIGGMKNQTAESTLPLVAPPLLKAFNTSRGIFCLACMRRGHHLGGMEATSHGDTFAHMCTVAVFVSTFHAMALHLY